MPGCITPAPVQRDRDDRVGALGLRGGVNYATAERLAAELATLAEWLGLTGISVRPQGDLAKELDQAVRHQR